MKCKHRQTFHTRICWRTERISDFLPKASLFFLVRYSEINPLAKGCVWVRGLLGSGSYRRRVDRQLDGRQASEGHGFHEVDGITGEVQLLQSIQAVEHFWADALQTVAAQIQSLQAGGVVPTRYKRQRRY